MNTAADRARLQAAEGAYGRAQKPVEQKGPPADREALCRKYAPLIYRIAKRVRRRTGFAVELDDLVAVYDAPEDVTPAPVQVQLAAAGVTRPRGDARSALGNPFADLQQSELGPAPEILRLYPPELHIVGDAVFVEIGPGEGAVTYTVYVSAYPDGAGAVR